MPSARRPVSPADAAMLQAAILHRDDDLIVLNKPPGLAVQGGTRSERHLDGLLDALRFGHAERPRLVHRLDKDTSGVLVIARTVMAAAFLTRAFRDKTTRKIYWALAVGRPNPAQGRIGLALAKQPGPRAGQGGGERVRADPDEGKPAITYYRVVDNAGERASWLALLPVTGRTHQLRAHCAAIGDADPRRPEIWRRRRAIGGRAQCRPAASACPRAVDSPPAGRYSAGSGAAAGAYAAELGLLRLCRRRQGSVCRVGPAGMKRFYQQAGVAPAGRGYGVALDGKPVKTPARRDLIAPTAALAAAIAVEWNSQEREVRPAAMPLTQLANTAIDRVAPQRTLVVQQIADYAGTDLVCYRATRPPQLAARQQAVWQPLLDWAVRRYDAPLEVTTGVVPIAQPPASLRALAAAVAETRRFRAGGIACDNRGLRLAGHRAGAGRGSDRRRKPLPPRSSTRASRSKPGARIASRPSAVRRWPARSARRRISCRCCAPEPRAARSTAIPA